VAITLAVLVQRHFSAGDRKRKGAAVEDFARLEI
jgi:hypothetical protein